MQRNVYLIQMVSKTSACHIQLDSNRVLKSYAFPVQQTFWEQNEEVTPNFVSKFAVSAQQHKPSQVTAVTFLQGAEQPASFLRLTYSDLLYPTFTTLKGKSRDTQALSAVLA